MKAQSYSTSFTTEKSPQEVFAAINNVRGWWSQEVIGGTEKVGDVFTYHYRDVHSCKMKLTEVIPNQKVVWHVLDNNFNFTEDKTEWIDTDVIFEVAKKGNQTEVRLTHDGLGPDYECFDVCKAGWTTYFNGSLQKLIATGKGNPNEKES